MWFEGRELTPGVGCVKTADLAGERFDPSSIRSLPQADGADHGWFTLEMGDTWIDVYPAREDDGVRELDQALECLMHCALRHRQWDGTLRPISHAPKD